MEEIKEIKESKRKLEEFIYEIFKEAEVRELTIRELEYLPILLKNKVDIQVDELHTSCFKLQNLKSFKS